MHFSKTSILAGLRCEKQLHLKVHHPELAGRHDTPASVTGRVVGRHARQLFPGGILIERGIEHGAAATDPVARTAALLDDANVTALFEAGFDDGEITVFVDILVRDGTVWDVIEVKAATSVKDHHIDDVATQALTLSRAGLPVGRYYLMHINSGFVYPGGQDYDGLLIKEDITERVLSHRDFIAAAVERFKTVVEGAQPDIHLGSYCKNPYPCEFRRYCETQDADYPVSCLPNVKQTLVDELIANRIYDIRDIPPDRLKSETQLRVRHITAAGRPECGPEAARILAELDFPRYYLDFEAIQFAIPIWPGTSAFQQLPFQWSCHIQTTSAELTHREFLDVSGADPRRGFAESLIDACGKTGAIIVYNQSFEKRIIRELAAELPDLAEALLALNERIFDLLPVVRQYYYHPDMKGSWSIKSVLPCLVPELSYASLGSVQDGTQAQSVYLDLIGDETATEVKQLLEKDLRQYCQLDTWAMVKIVEKMPSG